MQIPLSRKPKPYEAERQRLLETLKRLDPTCEDYDTVMSRLNQLDRILNRTSEKFKTVIPALGTVAGVAGIYALQQFAGVIVPKALDAIASRSTAKNQKELD